MSGRVTPPARSDLVDDLLDDLGPPAPTAPTEPAKPAEEEVTKRAKPSIGAHHSAPEKESFKVAVPLAAFNARVEDELPENYDVAPTMVSPLAKILPPERAP